MKSIVHVITGLADGGAEGVLYRLCAFDRENRHSVISLTGEGKYGPLLSNAGAEVACLGMPRGRVTIAGLAELRRSIRRARPDVVQTWMYHANLVGGVMARLAGVSNVCWGIRQTHLDPAEASRSVLLANKVSARLSRVIPRLIICCAHEAQRAHVEAGYDRSRMVVIPNGYDFSAFRPDRASGMTLRRSLNLPAERQIIGCVARFHKFKGHANLLAALSILRESGVTPDCLLVGEGMDPSNEDIVADITRHGLEDRVHLLGPRNDIARVMNALDVHVLSSSTEGFPSVIAEAMACGTPCISTDVGDAASIVGDIGLIVPPKDPQAMAAAIGMMLSDQRRRGWRARQEAARDSVTTRFSIEGMVASYHRAWFQSEDRTQLLDVAPSGKHRT